MKTRRLSKIIFILAAVLLLSAAAAFALTGWPRPASPPERHIVYIFKTTLGEIEFWRSAEDGIATGAEEFGYRTTILGAREEWDIDGNIQALERAVAMKPDAIVLVAADYERLAPHAQAVRDAGIPLLTLDSAVEGDAARCFVGTDNYAVGIRMAEELLARAGAGGPVAIVGHVAEAKTGIDRVRGTRDALAVADGFTLLEPVYCDNRISRAKEQAAAILKANPTLAGFVATNEMSAIGVCQAVVDAGLQEEVVVVTCDNSSRQIEYLEQGVIAATVVQKPFDMGYFSVKMAYELLDGGGEVPEFYDTGCTVITLENYFTLENQKLLFPVWD